MKNGISENFAQGFFEPSTHTVTIDAFTYLGEANNDRPLKNHLMSEICLNNPLTTQNVDLKEMLEYIESSYIQQALEKTKGVVTHAAEKLGLRRTTLIEKMRKYKIKS